MTCGCFLITTCGSWRASRAAGMKLPLPGCAASSPCPPTGMRANWRGGSPRRACRSRHRGAAGAFSGVVVARIVSVERHPQADKLKVCQVVTDGMGGAAAARSTSLQIVCGAPNARAGLVSALARVGALLPNDVKISAATLRGVTRRACCAPRANWDSVTRPTASWNCRTMRRLVRTCAATSTRRSDPRGQRDTQSRRCDVGARRGARCRALSVQRC